MSKIEVKVQKSHSFVTVSPQRLVFGRMTEVPGVIVAFYAR